MGTPGGPPEPHMGLIRTQYIINALQTQDVPELVIDQMYKLVRNYSRKNPHSVTPGI